MILRFTIGPVQDFVRQSRRTRDLWGSSFLLSYLSGCAMHGAATYGKSKIILPRIENDKLYAFIEGRQKLSTIVGSLPNRFEIETDNAESAEGAAKAAAEALHKEWKRICQVVWDEFIAPIAHLGNDTKTIFDRQVDAFWEVQWVAAPDEQQIKGLLEARKAWRSRLPTEEPGDKCLIMPQFQELSGYCRAQGTVERKAQDTFWEKLKAHKSIRDYELRTGERLCAIALVKRLYAQSEKTFGWNLKEEVKNWRSTLYVAAIPWIEEVLKDHGGAARQYAANLCAIDPDVAHEKPHQEMTLKGADKTFASLDANCFHVDALGNSEATFTDVPITAERRRALQKDLQRLYGKDEKNPLGPPASFYALLLMDGDRVGNLLADANFGGAKVSNALATFTAEVQGIVNNHKGSTVYAGGDDVLAMVPVPNVLPCARELREAYRKAFNHNERATTSAGIVLAHIRRPLLEVLDEAHRLLDDVAKEGNGRDSIAISLLRSGDRALQWTSTWQDENGRSRIDVVTEMREMWRDKSTRQREGDTAPLVAGEMSSGLVYRLRETMGLLCAWPRWEAGVSQRFFEGLNPQKLFAAEIRRMRRASGLEGEHDEANQKEADAMAAKLLELVHPVERTTETNGNPPIIKTNREFIGLDGLLLALFLSTDGKERDHGAMEARS